jgi:predicted nucleotidyltransferase component of viral defense system
LSDELPDDLRAVADFFGLPGTASVAKDFYVVRAIKALAAIDTAPLQLIFAGGTALARAHKLVQRMSEDVDFKVVLPPPTTLSRNGQRKRLGELHHQVVDALVHAGFTDTPKGKGGDENRYVVWDVPYETTSGVGEGLRPTIKIELTFAQLRLPSLTLPVSSFVTEAFKQPPEVPAIACVSLAETAAEKLVSLTRRTAMELAGLSRDPDPTLVRHIYDLYALRDHVDPVEVANLAHEIAKADAAEFRNQYPAYAADIAGETHKAIDALCNDPMQVRRYADFIAAMVYGEQTEFDDAMSTVATAVHQWVGT